MAQGVLTRGKGEERIPVASLHQPRRLGQQGHSSDRWPLPGHALNYREPLPHSGNPHTPYLEKSSMFVIGRGSSQLARRCKVGFLVFTTDFIIKEAT